MYFVEDQKPSSKMSSLHTNNTRGERVDAMASDEGTSEDCHLVDGSTDRGHILLRGGEREYGFGVQR
jgi:hypothetical protein